MRPLALSDHQISVIRYHAKAIPIEFRDRYLCLLADRLNFEPEVNDEVVTRTAIEVAGRMFHDQYFEDDR